MELKNIIKTYKSRKGITTEALSNVSYSFPDKGMVFILGKSGCGKTTLLNILGNIDSPTSGEFIYYGNNIDFKQKTATSFRANEVSFIFQDYNLIDELTVKDNLRIADSIDDDVAFNAKVEQLLLKTGLDSDVLKKHPKELSGGQQQRVALLRALLKPHNVILADEPTGNIDSATGREIFEMLKNISREKLVIVVSHDRDSAETYGDEIVRIEDGKIISGEGKEKEENVRKSFTRPNKMKPSAFMKMVGINFRKKLFTLFIALLLCVICVGSICYTRSIGNFDYIENTILTFEKNNITSYSVIPKGNGERIDLLYEGYKGRKSSYYKMVNYSGFDLSDKMTNMFKEKYPSAQNVIVNSDYVVIDKNEDISMLFGSQSRNLVGRDGVYISDICADLLAGKYQYSEDKANLSDIEKPSDIIGNYVYCSDSSHNPYIKVLGIFKTDFYDKFNNYEQLSNRDRIMFQYDLAYKYLNLYGSEQYLNETLSPRTEMSSAKGDSIKVLTDNGESIDIKMLSGSSSGYQYVLTSDNEVVKDIELNNNEIVVSLDVYNKIYGTSYSASSIVDMNTHEVFAELDFDKSIDVYLRSDNGNVILLEGLRLKGVILDENDLFDVYKRFVSINADNLVPLKLNDNGIKAILTEDMDYQELRGIMGLSGYYIDAPYMSEINNYNTDGKLLNGDYRFISLIFGVFFVFLMYYIMNNIVMNQQKNIGIMMSLGISKVRCTMIHLVFALMFSLIVSVILAIAVPVMMHLTNISLASDTSLYYGLQLVRVDGYIIFCVVFMPMAVSMAASLVPFFRLFRMKPIDVINKR